MAGKIDFWFSIGSTYTYLSMMRLADIERAHGISFTWRPFNLRVITSKLGNRPFVGKPQKLRYMWNDIKRRSQKYGINIKVPAPYPLPELERANLVAVLGQKEGWCAEYTRATYIRWFQDGLEPGTEKHMKTVLSDLGLEPETVLRNAASDEISAALADSTDEADRLGIFGAPSFVVDKELFWGDDRLEDAVHWRKAGTLDMASSAVE